MERAKAYDRYLRQIQQKAIDKTVERGAVDWQKERNRIRIEALQNSKLLIRKAIAMLNFPLVRKQVRDGKTIVEPAKWAMTDAAKFVETADKLQRLAAEMETSNDQVTIIDQRARIEQAIEKFIADTGTSRQEAIEYLAPLIPDMSKYVN